MSKFEFTVTIVSIIIAFALSELMAGWGRILRHRPRPRIDWLFAAWSIGVLINGIFHWSGLWVYADVDFRSVRQLYVLMAPPLVLVPIAFLLAPNPQAGTELDLRAYFGEVARPFFLLSAAFMTLTVAADLVVGGVSVFGIVDLMALGLASAYAAAAYFASDALRMAVLAVSWVGLLAVMLGIVQAPGW